MGFFFSLIFFIFIAGVVVVLFLLGLLRSLLGFRKDIRKNSKKKAVEYGSPRKTKSKKKIFDKDEGEYVDYEEV